MNIKIASLSIITILASSTVSVVPALAGEAPQEGGQRWKFAPNIYKREQPRMPREYETVALPAPVVPHMPSNLLGLTPNDLHPVPKAPSIARASVQPTVATHSISSSFQNNFGTPIAPPVVATLPKTATPLALPPAKQLATPAAPSKIVSGYLKPHKQRTVGTSAGPVLALGKKVESYGNNFGYTPGNNLTHSGPGSSVDANVFGRILTHKGR